MATAGTYYGSVHLLFYEQGRVLLLKRANTGYADGLWSVVAGRIDQGEEVVEAAIREAREEAGVEIARSDIEVIGVLQRLAPDSEWIDFFLKVKHWKGRIRNVEPDKCEALDWYPIQELPEDTLPYVRDAILRTKDRLWFASNRRGR